MPDVGAEPGVGELVLDPAAAGVVGESVGGVAWLLESDGVGLPLPDTLVDGVPVGVALGVPEGEQLGVVDGPPPPPPGVPPF